MTFFRFGGAASIVNEGRVGSLSTEPSLIRLALRNNRVCRPADQHLAGRGERGARLSTISLSTFLDGLPCSRCPPGRESIETRAPVPRDHSVDLHRPALDPVHSGRPVEEVGSTNENFARACEDDGGLTAAQSDFLLGRENEALAV